MNFFIIIMVAIINQIKGSHVTSFNKCHKKCKKKKKKKTKKKNKNLNPIKDIYLQRE